MNTPKILMLFFCMSSILSYGQNLNQYSPLSLSLDTQFPIQNDIRIFYTMRNLPHKTAIGAFFQLGMPAYLNESIDIIFDKSGKENPYLKNNLEKKCGAGFGILWKLYRWQINILYQNTGYKIRNKPARELIENLAPESTGNVVNQINDFADKFPPFGNIYESYLLEPNFRLHQFVLEGGYKFQFPKQSRFGIQIKAGIDIFFDSTLETITEQQNLATDFLVKVVNDAVNQKINTKVQGLVKPIASFSIHYNL